MPRVTLTANGVATPNPVILKRDDQTIMWQLDQGVRWVLNEGPPVQFLGSGGEYTDWPGTAPAPIQTGAGADRRPYWASADHPMADGETAKYHYRVNVEALLADGQTWQKLEIKVQHGDGTWHDPDVQNEPQP